MKYTEARKALLETSYPIRRASWPTNKAMMLVIIGSALTAAGVTHVVGKYLEQVESPIKAIVLIENGNSITEDLTEEDLAAMDWEVDHGLDTNKG